MMQLSEHEQQLLDDIQSDLESQLFAYDEIPERVPFSQEILDLCLSLGFSSSSPGGYVRCSDDDILGIYVEDTETIIIEYLRTAEDETEEVHVFTVVARHGL